LVNSLENDNKHILNRDLQGIYKLLFRATKLSPKLFTLKNGQNLLSKLNGEKLRVIISHHKGVISTDHQVLLSHCGIPGLTSFDEKMETMAQNRQNSLACTTP
jgi:hypothetical protein